MAKRGNQKLWIEGEQTKQWPKEAIRSCESKENRQNNGQKRQSEAVNRRKTDKTMAKRGNQKLWIEGEQTKQWPKEATRSCESKENRQNNGQKRQSEAVNRRRTDQTMAKWGNQKLWIEGKQTKQWPKEAIRSCESKENRQNNGQKRQSEAVNRRRTDKTMAKRGNQKLLIEGEQTKQWPNEAIRSCESKENRQNNGQKRQSEKLWIEGKQTKQWPKEAIRSCESKENRQNNGQKRQPEAVNRRRTDKRMAKKRQSEGVNQRRTDKTMAKRGNQKLWIEGKQTKQWPKEVIRSCESKENRQNNGQKKQSEAVNRRRTGKTMAKRGNQKLWIEGEQTKQWPKEAIRSCESKENRQNNGQKRQSEAVIRSRTDSFGHCFVWSPSKQWPKEAIRSCESK